MISNTTVSPRFRAAMRYLGTTDPIYKWRIGVGPCPSCGGRYFLSMLRDHASLVNAPFMTRCLKCRANITNLSLIPVIRQHLLQKTVSTAYEMSTYGATLDYLAKCVPNIISSEYYPGRKPGELVDGVRNEDVQELSMPNETIDLITSNQVFEHVPDDIKGYSECFRVLKPGGALIFSIPMSDRPQTLQAAELVEGQLLHHMEPEYHDSRTEGPNCALVFWHHSQRDICDRVQQAGFIAKIMDVMISSVQIVPQKVIYAIKPEI